MSRRKPPGALRRPPPRRRPHLLVFTEGRRTEPGYLESWHRIYRDRVQVTIDEFHGTPQSLVDRAVDAQREDRRNARRGQGSAYDEVWCVFDRDDHPHLNDALGKAANSGIEVALSTPCIELWFLLHFQDQTAQIHRGGAQSLSRGHLNCEKNPSPAAFEMMETAFKDAKRRARELDAKHDGDGSEPHANPSSSVWRLIDRMSGAGLD